MYITIVETVCIKRIFWNNQTFQQIHPLVKNTGTAMYNQSEISIEKNVFYQKLYHKREHDLDKNLVIEHLSVCDSKLDEKESEF